MGRNNAWGSRRKFLFFKSLLIVQPINIVSAKKGVFLRTVVFTWAYNTVDIYLYIFNSTARQLQQWKDYQPQQHIDCLRSGKQVLTYIEDEKKKKKKGKIKVDVQKRARATKTEKKDEWILIKSQTSMKKSCINRLLAPAVSVSDAINAPDSAVAVGRRSLVKYDTHTPPPAYISAGNPPSGFYLFSSSSRRALYYFSYPVPSNPGP